MRFEIRQADLAELVGYEQSYISALEVGSKGPPTPEFIDKLVSVLELSGSDERELREAAIASDRKLVLDHRAPRDLYLMFNDLRSRAVELNAGQIRAIREVIRLSDQASPNRPEALKRLPRRRREEVST